MILQKTTSYILTLLACITVLASIPTAHAQNKSTSNSNGRGHFGSSPIEILDTITHQANKNDAIQSTALDSINHSEGSYAPQYRLANTFDSIRKRSAPYIDRMFYIGLSVATILIIRQGLQLVTGKELGDIRKPMINIATGVMVLTGAYLIIKVTTGILALIFNIS